MGSDPQSSGGDEPTASGDAELRTRRLEAQLSAVTARVFQLEREVAALHGMAPPVAAVPPVLEEQTVPGAGAAPGAAAGAPRPATYAAAPPREPLVMHPAARQARPVGDS